MTVTPAGKWMQGIKTIAAPLLACGLLASCASVIGPRQVEVPLTKLQQGLERRFPLKHKILSVFDIQLSHPRLAILPDNDRVALTVEASVAPPFIRQSWSGQLAMSGRLSVDAARNAVFISDAAVDRVVVDGVDEARQRQFAKVASLATDQLVRDTPLYTFRPEELRFAGVQFVPTRISTTPDSLVVTFAPAR